MYLNHLNSSGYSIPGHMTALYEEIAGILAPEKMIQAHADVARYHGAHIQTGEQVTGVIWACLT